jgi:hypothetical protein
MSTVSSAATAPAIISQASRLNVRGCTRLD